MPRRLAEQATRRLRLSLSFLKTPGCDGVENSRTAAVITNFFPLRRYQAFAFERFQRGVHRALGQRNEARSPFPNTIDQLEAVSRASDEFLEQRGAWSHEPHAPTVAGARQFLRSCAMASWTAFSMSPPVSYA